MKTGVELITEERARQVSQEGYTPEHDDEHECGELASAGSAYAEFAADQACDVPASMPWNWPWGDQDWKPKSQPIDNLVKAGALIAAEIDRLQRRNAKDGNSAADAAASQ